MTKYKLEFEMPDSFEKGCCYDCPLAEYSNLTKGYSRILCIDWNEPCPLEEVE
jgi:hypothetical protein